MRPWRHRAAKSAGAYFFYYRARPPSFPPLRPNLAFRRGAWAELRCPVSPLARVPPMSPTGPRPASASRGAPRSSYVVAPPTGGLRESGSALRARVFVGYRESMAASRIGARFVLTSESRYAAKRLGAVAPSRTRPNSYSRHCLAFRVPYSSAYVSKRKARSRSFAWARAFGSAPHVRSEPRNGRRIRVAEAVALRHRLLSADGAGYPLRGFSVEYAR